MDLYIIRMLISVSFTGVMFSAASAQFYVAPDCCVGRQSYPARDLMDTSSFSLRDYRQLFMQGVTPTAEDLVGTWRGKNKGVVTLFGFKDFIKDIRPTECGLFGDNENIDMRRMTDCCDSNSVLDFGLLQQDNDRFKVKSPDCIGRFGHGVIFSYREGGNRKFAASRLLVDKVVKIDDCHLLGRATARTVLGPVPIAYFVLERVR